MPSNTHERRHSSSFSSSSDRSPPYHAQHRSPSLMSSKTPSSPTLSSVNLPPSIASQRLDSHSPISSHRHPYTASPAAHSPASLSLSDQLTSGSFLVSVGAGFIAKVCSDIFYGYFDLEEPESWAEIAKRGAGYSLLNWMAFSVTSSASSETQVATFVVGALLTMLAANFDGPPERGAGEEDRLHPSFFNVVSHRIKSLPSGVCLDLQVLLCCACCSLFCQGFVRHNLSLAGSFLVMLAISCKRRKVLTFWCMGLLMLACCMFCDFFRVGKHT